MPRSSARSRVRRVIGEHISVPGVAPDSVARQSGPMLEDMLDPDSRRVFDSAFRLLSDGPMDATVLVGTIRAAGGFDHLDGVDDELIEDLLAILESTDRVWITESEDVHRIDLLLEGLTLTHRLTEREVEEGAIEIGPDLTMIDFDLEGADRLIGGVAADVDISLERGWHAWMLKDGLPLVLQPGDLIGLTRVGDRLDLSYGADFGAEVAAAETSEIVDALADAFDEVGIDGIGMETTQVVMGLLCESRYLFASPLPPLLDLLDDAGVSRQGDFFGPADVSWDAPGVRFARDRREELYERWQFGECCVEAFELVDEAVADHVGGADPRHPTAAIRSAIHHRAVSLALKEHWTFLGPGPTALTTFLEPVADTVRRDGAPARYLLGWAAENDGRVEEAEDHYRQAMTTDADFVPPIEELGLISFDRGDLPRAVSLLDRSQAAGQRHPVAELIDRIAPRMTGVGRNDPCPCGSGRKFKACHSGTAVVDEAARPKLLLHKALVHLHRRHGAVLRAVLLGAGIDAAERLVGDDFVADVAVFEGGVLEEFVGARAALLPPAELDMATQWLDTSRRLYEVVEVDPGERIDLRDLTSGDRFDIVERAGSQGRHVGDYLLCRVVVTDSVPAVIGTVIEVPMHSRQSLLTVLDAGAETDDLVGWYAAVTGPPGLSNRSGHDLVFCETTVDPSVPTARAAAGLDALFDAGREGDDGRAVWHWATSTEVADERLIAASITADGNRLHITTNSEERADEVLELLRSEFADLVVESDVRTPMAELQALAGDRDDDFDDELTGMIEPEEAPPELQEALRQYMRRYEESWIDESIPALDGLTPREAIEDPTRRLDVERLLAGFPPTDDSGSGMDPERIRSLLGLVED